MHFPQDGIGDRSLNSTTTANGAWLPFPSGLSTSIPTRACWHPGTLRTALSVSVSPGASIAGPAPLGPVCGLERASRAVGERPEATSRPSRYCNVFSINTLRLWIGVSAKLRITCAIHVIGSESQPEPGPFHCYRPLFTITIRLSRLSSLSGGQLKRPSYHS